VDTATAAMTSLLEPVMIVFLALVVGTIGVALFLPIVIISMDFGSPNAELGE
jgi:type IV pilus assembly protein PilC